MAKKSNIPTLAPETETGTATGVSSPANPATPPANATVDEEPAKRKVASHTLIDANGVKLPDDQSEEHAWGIRYTLLANNQSFDYVYGKSPDMDRMLACFGAKTLATNETSQARNNPKGEGTADEQIAAVRDRFAGLASGVWVDRTRDGVGAKVDKDALAEALCRVFVASGKKTQADIDGGYKATIRQKLEDDAGYARSARQNPAVSAEYAAIVGRQVKTVDDLMV